LCAVLAKDKTFSMDILFITANRVGDAVLSTGLLAHLVARYPDAQFTIACGPYGAGLFRGVPHIKKLIILKKQPWNRHWISLWRECAGTRWGLIVDLRNSIVSRLLRAKKRACYRGNSGKHKVVENAALLGLNPPPAPYLWLDAEAEKAAAQLLPATRPILALGPAANWPCKQWPVERFAALVQMLTAPDGPLPNAQVLIIADGHERAQLIPLLESLPADRRTDVIGYGLLTVAACLKQSALFIGNDSGLMHMAAAVGTPTLGLFGPGYEEIYRPWGSQCAFVRTLESREDLLARLPYPGAHYPNLMEGLSVDAVYEAAQKLLTNARIPVSLL
jgi:lipopolysaccharide export system permease protein